MYKKIGYGLFIFCIVIFAYFYFLFETGRIIFLSGNKLLPSQALSHELLEHKAKQISEVYLNEKNERILIPIKITETLFDKKNPEIFFYDAFFQFIRYINLYEMNNFFITLDHVAFNQKNLIINMSLSKKKETSIIQETNLVKSIYNTARTIIPYIEHIYFYNQIEELNFIHIEPYINKEIMNFRYIEEKKEDFFVERDQSEKSIIIPLLSKTTGPIIVDNIFEKNIFQSLGLKNIYFSKNSLYEKEWQKEIQVLIQNEYNFFYFVNFFKGDIPSILIIMYPFLSEEIPFQITDIEDKKLVFNKTIFQKVSNIKKIAEQNRYTVSVEIMPLKSIMLLPENALYVAVIGRDKEEMKDIFEKIIV